MTLDDNMINRLKEAFLNRLQKINPKINPDDFSDVLEKIIKYRQYDAKVKTDGGMFWYITMRFAETLSSANSLKGNKSNTIVEWNKLFRELGIAGCVDNGEGIIHTSEPSQAVFFSASNIDLIARVDNHKIQTDKIMEYDIERFIKKARMAKTYEDVDSIFNQYFRFLENLEMKMFLTYMNYQHL